MVEIFGVGGEHFGGETDRQGDVWPLARRGEGDLVVVVGDLVAAHGSSLPDLFAALSWGMVEPKPRVVRIPFVRKGAPMGLGTLISHATTAVGFKPCERCKKRAKKLNQRLLFEGRNER